MAKLVLIMRSTPGGVAISGADVEFALASGGGPFATDTTDVDGLASWEADGSPGPILANAVYNGATKYYDGRTESQLGTWFTADLPIALRALGNGVVKGYTDAVVTSATDLAVSPGTGLKLAVAKGAFLLDGHVYRRSGATQLDVTANSSGSTRYDRVIFRFTREGQAEEGKFELVMLDGTSDSAGPSLTNTTAVQEFSLAKVAVVNGATSFVAGDITDERSSSTLSQGYARTLPSGLVNGDILTVQSGVLARLAKGTDAQVLTLASGLPAWVTPTFSIVLQVGDVTVDANVSTIDFDSASFAGSSSPSGEANISIKALGISNAQLAAGIDAAKVGDGSVSNTEFQYISGLTGDVQNQINALAGGGNVTGAGSSVAGQLAAFSDTTGKAIAPATSSISLLKLVSGALQAATANDLPSLINPTKIGTGNVSLTEFGYLASVTSDIQDQLDAKSALTHTHVMTAALYGEAVVDHTAQNIGTSSTTWGNFNLGPLVNGVTYDVEAHSSVAGNASSTGFIKGQIRIEAGGTVVDGMDTGTENGERTLEAHTHKVVVGAGSSINIAGRAQSTAGTGYVNSGLVWAKATPRLIPAS